MNLPSLLTTTLLPYAPTADKPWIPERAQHLLQRIGFGGTKEAIDTALTMSPEAFVDAIIDGIRNQAPPEPPPWANWNYEDYNGDDDLYFEHKFEFFRRWISEMITDGLRPKLALFWSNHFVTEEEVYDCNGYMWSYYRLLHDFALGNFRTFVETMGKNPAMLVYLNGNLNIAEEPNENYARELLELFTMGEGNGYTQDDIVEVARALTGWQLDMYNCDQSVTLDDDLFDNTPKTIFGQTGNWNYEDVHELIFSFRKNEVAQYICTKIYRYFVYDKPDLEIIQGMTQTFIDNNWELAPVFRQLFKSEHFFEERFINTRIKSPLEVLVQPYRLTGITFGEAINDDWTGYINYMIEELGQKLFSPIDVAGWPGYHDWINENTLTIRWQFLTDIIYGGFLDTDAARDRLRELAIALTSSTETDPLVVTQALIRHFLKKDLEPELTDTALAYFKGEIPENYFATGSWNLWFNESPYQIVNLLFYLFRLPEWQLS